MLILVGSSASGKTELANYLKKNFGYFKCITTTTRPKRHHETQDVDYHFVTTQTFDTLNNDFAFVETNVYHGYFYGLQVKDMKENSLVILDPNGANHIVSTKPKDVFVCYVQSLKVTREKRMRMRGDDHETITKRIREDDDIFKLKHLKKIDFILMNENKTFDELATELHEAYQLWKKEK